VTDKTEPTHNPARIPDISLNDGTSIPQLGFGVFQIPPAETKAAVLTALELGYRHIDTAEMYGNEKEVGEAIHESGIAREDIYVTTKLNNGFHEPDKAREAYQLSLDDLNIGYLDLFLIHWPLPTLYGGDYPSTWNALAQFKSEGLVKSVGVSNFQIEHLQRLAAETDLVPAVNQIEAHPYFTNTALRDYGAEHAIATEAWSPIAQGAVLDDQVITEIAGRVGRSTAQVVLRWHIQLGNIVFPKSVSEKRISENAEIFDFELDAESMAAISGLDRGEAGRRGPNPDVFDWIPG